MAGPGFAQKKEEKIVFDITPEFRKFLESHMRQGKKVDDFLNAINERAKTYGVDILKLDKSYNVDIKKSKGRCLRNIRYKKQLRNFA